MNEENINTENTGPKPPVVIDGLTQPGFPAKVFTCLFFQDCMVFCKTGSFSTNAAGTMQASLGGFTGAALIGSAIGAIVDSASADSRSKQAASMSALDPADIVKAHKNNFIVPYNTVSNVEIKGPNFAGEVKVIVCFSGKEKFRIDRQSKASAKYIVDTFSSFLPGKVKV